MSLVAVRLCVLAMAAGEPITTVAARLGHRDLSITLRVYAHLLPGQDRAAADRLDGLWRGMDAGFDPDSTVTRLPGTVGA